MTPHADNFRHTAACLKATWRRRWSRMAGTSFLAGRRGNKEQRTRNKEQGTNYWGSWEKMIYFAAENRCNVIELGRHFRNLIVQLLDWFHFPFQRYLPRETFQYGATGGINTLLDIFLYWFFYELVLEGEIVEFSFVAISAHIAAFLIVFPITFSTGFIMAKYITFKASLLRGRKQLFRYALTVAGAIFLNYIFLKLFVEAFHLPALGAKIATTVIVVTYSYTLQRYFTFQTGSFKKRPKEEDRTQ